MIFQGCPNCHGTVQDQNVEFPVCLNCGWTDYTQDSNQQWMLEAGSYYISGGAPDPRKRLFRNSGLAERES